MTTVQIAEEQPVPDEDDALRSWTAPRRFRLFWFLPLGYDAEGLKEAALAAWDDERTLRDLLRRQRRAVERLQLQVTPLRPLRDGDESSADLVAGLAGLTAASLPAPLREVLPCLLDHLRAVHRRAVAEQARRAAAERAIAPLRLEEARLEELHATGVALRKQIALSEAAAAAAAYRRQQILSEVGAVHDALHAVQRRAALRLALDGRRDVADALADVLRRLPEPTG